MNSEGDFCCFEKDSEPCYGEINVVTDDWYEDNFDFWYVYACEGHQDCWWQGGKYKPKENNL